jgi:hypothetical protein
MKLGWTGSIHLAACCVAGAENGTGEENGTGFILIMTTARPLVIGPAAGGDFNNQTCPVFCARQLTYDELYDVGQEVAGRLKVPQTGWVPYPR